MARGLNGETVLNLDNVLIGYVDGEPYGYRSRCPVRVEVRMERLDRQDAYETTDHRQVTRPLDFAITFAVWQPGGRDIVASSPGDSDALDSITTYARGWDAARVAELRELGRWHLNATTAGCDHQKAVYREGRYGREVDLDHTPPCPVTGYRYGHAWLVRELPEGFEARVRAAFGVAAA